MQDASKASLSGIVYRGVKRTDRNVVDAAQICTSADVYDVLGHALGSAALMQPSMRPLKLSQRSAVGPAITAISRPGDNLMVHRALSLAQPGDVVIVSSPFLPAALWGMNAAKWARLAGVMGFICDGAVRDAAELAEMDPPTWCTVISARGPLKEAGGAVNVPITCAGVTVNPGDLVVADADGVIVIPRHLAADVVERVRRHQEASAAERARLDSQGPTLYERRDYGAVMSRLGIEELDRAWGDA